MKKYFYSLVVAFPMALALISPANVIAQTPKPGSIVVPIISFLLDDTVPVAAGPYTPSGKVTYDRVATTTMPIGLDYSNITQKPVRGATVQLLSGGGAVLESTVTDTNGNFTFGIVRNEPTRVRVRAELFKTTTGPQYDVKVVDNTSSNALYTLVESNATNAPIRSLNASSGWGGSSYTTTRAAAPFAILDSIFEAIADMSAVDTSILFPPLQVNWSINNVPTKGDLAAGQIGTSFYNDSNLYILGKENNDTDEFDDHIIIHEWGHYFEDKLSRSDSVGGDHSNDDRLDMRVAFGEGFGNALSGMVLEDPIYVDSSGQGQTGTSGFIIDLENNPTAFIGWYSEASIQSLIYDLFDTEADGSDAVALGFGPIYNVLVNQQKNSPVFTSIFSFATALKADNPAQASAISTLLASQSIVGSTINATGSTETNNAGLAGMAVLPIYSTLTVNGPAVTVCTRTDFNGAEDSNKLSNYRFLTFNIASIGSYTVSMTRVAPLPSYGDTDPQFTVFRNGSSVFAGNNTTVNSEDATGDLAAGLHAMQITDFNISTGSRGTACFDVDIVQNPS